MDDRITQDEVRLSDPAPDSAPTGGDAVGADAASTDAPNGAPAGLQTGRQKTGSRALIRRFAERARSLLDRVSPSSAFLCIALLWGAFLVFYVPPFQHFDEVAHYYRAYSLSMGQWMPDSSSEVVLPQAVVDLPWRLDFIEVGELRHPYSVERTWKALGDSTQGNDVEVICFANSPNPTGHLPMAAGVGVARILHLSPLAALYAGRLVNMIAAVVMIFFAIRMLPFGKPYYVLVGLMPMTMIELSAVNPDALTIAGAMLVFAALLNVSRRSDVGNRTLIAIVIAAALLLNVKSGYILLGFLVFLIPPRVFGGRWRWLAWSAALLVAVFAVAGLTQLATPPASQQLVDALYGSDRGVNPAAQLEAVVDSPGLLVTALRNTAGTMSIGLLQNMVGILGRGYLPLSQTAVLLMVAAIGATLVAYRGGPHLLWQQRVLVFAVCGISLLAIAAGMYIAASPVGANVILGIQGRYFIPVLAIGLFGVHGVRRPPRWLAVLLLLGLVLALVFASISALGAYY